MKYKQIEQSPKTFVLVFETGDELAKGLLSFAQEQKLSAASFNAIDALSSVRRTLDAHTHHFPYIPGTPDSESNGE
jgi:predicted DNA-binding protein with PD1-like motif